MMAKPNSDNVLMTRINAAYTTCGFWNNLTAKSSSENFSLADKSDFEDSLKLLSRKIAVKPPETVKIRADHKVPYSPMRGMVKLWDIAADYADSDGINSPKPSHGGAYLRRMHVLHDYYYKRVKKKRISHAA